jgi:hypothetical protein
MASFMQQVKKLSSLDVFLLDFHNKLIKWWQENLKLRIHTTMNQVSAKKEHVTHHACQYCITMIYVQNLIKAVDYG